MDITSYLLGKKSGGGGIDISEYFLESGNPDGYLAQAIIKKIAYPINVNHRTDLSSLFAGFRLLEEATVINGESATTVLNMFTNCVSLQKIDIRDMILTNLVSGYAQMFGSTNSNRVPSDCLIIVKNQDQKNWMATNHSRFTNVKTVDEL